MSLALSDSLAWLRRQAWSYLAILAVLLAGSWLVAEYRRTQALSTQLAQAEAGIAQRQAALAAAQRRTGLAEQAVAGQVAVLSAARDAARQRLQQKEAEREQHRARHWPWAGLHGPDALLESRLLDEEVQVLARADRAAQERLEAAEALRTSATSLQRMQEQARAQRAEADRLRAQWHRVSADHPWLQRVPGSPAGAELDRLKAEVERLQQEAVRTEQAVAIATRSREVATWLRERSALDAALADLRSAEAAQASLSQALQGSRWQRVRAGWDAFVANHRQLFLLALLLLVGAALARLAVKLLLYYVLAPWASRRPPLRLLQPPPAAWVAAVGRDRAGRISAESVTVRLAPGAELLVRPEYLQSSSQRSSKRTAWLLDAALPFTSVLSGMYLLTRVRTEAGDALVLSPGRDPFDELALLDLPDGAALVCQPRALAGVMQAIGRPLRITRHWRAGSLHAWLTFQLRFLVLHGPCRLVLKGRRGVRLESAGGGRLIDQAATLAFDAGIPYGNVRTETFVPYWLGREELFNDRFGGTEGSYLYEERPGDRRGGVLLGRGVQGLWDAVLKVFGI